MLQELSASRFPLIPSLLCRELATLTCVRHDGNFFFLFFSPAEVCSAGFGKVFIPPALTSFKIRAVFIFPLDRNTSFFFFFYSSSLVISSWESTKSFSSFITSTWTHNGAHFPLVPILTLNSALFIVCDLWSGPGAPGCLRWLTFLTIFC